ncbi:MAG: O-antigen ligase family protein [Planctomycetaceae bacterium]
MSSKLIFGFTALFLIGAPLSVSADIDSAGPAKYARLATTGIIVVIGVLSGALFRGRSATMACLPFVAIWSISPTWSGSPLWGYFYKGMFAMVFLSGTAFALAPRTLKQLDGGLRFLGLVAALAALVVLFEYVLNPSGSVTHGRLAVGGINANTISQTAAPLAILCAYLALYDTRRAFKKFAIGGFSLLLMVLLLTGSRGGIMMALIGCGILMMPLAKRPGLLIMAIGLLFGCAFVAFEFLNVAEDARAITEMTKDTRSGIWKFAFGRFQSSPLIGIGWFTFQGRASWATVQSSYLQVLVETGLIGAAALLLAVLTSASKLWSARSICRNSTRAQSMWYLCAACLTASLFHGLVESSMVVGTALTPLLWGFSVGLVDALPQLARTDGGNRWPPLQWRWVWIPDNVAAESALRPVVVSPELSGS